MISHPLYFARWRCYFQSFTHSQQCSTTAVSATEKCWRALLGKARPDFSSYISYVVSDFCFITISTHSELGIKTNCLARPLRNCGQRTCQHLFMKLCEIALCISCLLWQWLFFFFLNDKSPHSEIGLNLCYTSIMLADILLLFNETFRHVLQLYMRKVQWYKTFRLKCVHTRDATLHCKLQFYSVPFWLYI